MKILILTALDNNDEIWYRCFIPFILSLRQTNYSDDIWHSGCGIRYIFNNVRFS